jgi:hypothetical protein
MLNFMIGQLNASQARILKKKWELKSYKLEV